MGECAVTLFCWAVSVGKIVWQGLSPSDWLAARDLPGVGLPEVACATAKQGEQAVIRVTLSSLSF